jgi:hypothetical protein
MKGEKSKWVVNFIESLKEHARELKRNFMILTIGSNRTKT